MQQRLCEHWTILEWCQRPATRRIAHEWLCGEHRPAKPHGKGIDMTTGEKRCPTDYDGDPNGEFVGCGSANIEGPDDEDYYDCRDCGLFFHATHVEWRAKVERDA